MSMYRRAEPGRVLIVGTESGWREYTPTGRGYAGELVLPNGPLTPYDPQDRGSVAGVQVWSIRDPRTPREKTP
jgi:hypothetical protein